MTVNRDIQKRYCSRALAVAIVIAMGLILAGYKPVAKGLVLGTLFSILNFILIGELLPLRTRSAGRRGVIVTIASLAGRYAIMAMPLIAALKFEMLDPAATVVGLFMIQLIILYDYFFKMFNGLREKEG